MRGLLSRTLALLPLLVCVFGAPGVPAGSSEEGRPGVRFEVVHIFVDPHGRGLGAYQVEVVDHTARSMVVGIEGGESEAYHEPPYYDPRALRNNRVIVAAFSLKPELPRTRTCVARLHVAVRGEEGVSYQVRLMAAASAAGEEIDAEVTIAVRRAL